MHDRLTGRPPCRRCPDVSNRGHPPRDNLRRERPCSRPLQQLIGIAVGAVGLWVWLRTASTSRLRLAEDQRRSILADADREAETTRREAQIEAREQAVLLRAEIEGEIQDSRLQMAKIEERVHQREAELDAKREELARREQGVTDRETHTKQLQEELKAGNEEMLRELERVGGLTLGEARKQLLERSEDMSATSSREPFASSRKKPGPTPSGGPGPSSPMRSSVSLRATRPRRPSASSSWPPTT